MKKMILAKKLNQENLSLEADLVITSTKERYPFELHMGLGECKLSRKDFEALPREVGEETMKELLPNKKVEFLFDEE